MRHEKILVEKNILFSTSFGCLKYLLKKKKHAEKVKKTSVKRKHIFCCQVLKNKTHRRNRLKVKIKSRKQSRILWPKFIVEIDSWKFLLGKKLFDLCRVYCD